VTALYVPAAASSRALTDADGFGPARELAAWKRRVIDAWPQVRIEHVESEAAGSGSLGQRLGSALAVRVSLALGELTRDDLAVEVVYGRPDEDDEIVRPAYATLTAEAAEDDEIVRPAYTTLTAEAAEAAAEDEPSAEDEPGAAEDEPSAVRYSGEVPLDRPGPFGYTVRVLPSHPLLDSRAELGLVTYPQAPAGMTNGDLR
jgi:starch phosphorylase